MSSDSVGINADQEFSAQETAPPKSKPKSKKFPLKSKNKTEPVNCYGQFLMFKKQKLQEKDPNAKLNRSDTLKEWKGMDQNEKDFFVECYRKEKEEMGDKYRNRELKLAKKDAGEKNKKQKKVKESKDAENPNLKFLEKLEAIDYSIGELGKENEVLREKISNLRVENAVFKYKLKTKSEELESLKDKYEQLVLQHNLCKL